MKGNNSSDYDMPLVSVIVPTKNSRNTLNACLESIKNQSYQNLEMIVVDNDSIDGTKEIALTFTKKVFDHGPERSAQRNFGARYAEGDYILAIDSDMELSHDVIEACVLKATNENGVLAIVIPEESFGLGFWARCKALERSFYIGVDWMEAARFFDRKIFDEMGGYDEGLTGTEDYDLPQRIEGKHGKGCINRVGELIYHNEQEINLFDHCRKKFYYAQTLIDYKLEAVNVEKYEKQSSFFKRLKLFLSDPIRFCKNPILGLGMLLMKTCEFGSGGLGYISAKIRRDCFRSETSGNHQVQHVEI